MIGQYLLKILLCFFQSLFGYLFTAFLGWISVYSFIHLLFPHRLSIHCNFVQPGIGKLFDIYYQCHITSVSKLNIFKMYFLYTAVFHPLNMTQ